MRKRTLLSLLSIFCVTGLVLPSLAEKSKESKPVDRGEKVFKQYCANCHAGGGNRVKPSRPLAESKELATIATFKSYLSAPPGHMPYYQSVVKDQKTLDALYRYCKKLKKPIVQASLEHLD